MPRILQPKNLRRFQIRRDAHAVPSHINRLVDVRRGPLQPRGIHLLLRRIEQATHTLGAETHPAGNFLNRSAHIEHVLRGIVMHLADLVDVIVQRRNLRFVFREHSAGFVQCPGEVVAIVIHRNVGVLRSVKTAALAVAQPLIHPADDVARHASKKLRAGGLVPVYVILQQFGIVVAHLLEVRYHPALIHRVTMKPSRQLVVNPAVRHVLKRGND